MNRISVVLRRPIESHGNLRLGLVTVGVIALICGGILGIGKLGMGHAVYTADFAQAAGISAGDQITVAGVRVGSVKGLRLDDDHVAVSMEIDNGLNLGADTRAAIKLTTLLGARYVDLQPAGTGRLPRRRIPLSNTEVPYDLQTALQDATTTFDAVDAEKVAQSMTTLSQQLEGSPEVLPQALDNIAHLSSVIGSRRSEIGNLLRSTKQVSELLSKQQRNLGLLMTQGRDVLADLSARQEVMVRLINATSRLVQQLQPVLVGDRQQTSELLANLNGMLASVGANDELFRNMLQVMPVPIRNFANATGSGNEFDFNSTGGTVIDSFMCAISGRAKQFNLPSYFEDCQ